MKRMLCVLLFLLLPCMAMAGGNQVETESISIVMQVGETLETGIFSVQNREMISGSSVLPFWLTMEERALTDGWQTILLHGQAIDVGRWEFQVNVRAYAQGDKKGKDVASINVCITVVPDDEGRIYLADTVYKNDGQQMLVVNTPIVAYCRTPGGTVLGQHALGERLIYVGLASHEDQIWQHIFSKHYGYGYILHSAEEERPEQYLFTPGEPVHVAVWTITCAGEKYTPEIDALEGITTSPQAEAYVQYSEDGKTMTVWMMCHFPAEEFYRVRCTLYDEAGMPVEVKLFSFDPVR